MNLNPLPGLRATVAAAALLTGVAAAMSAQAQAPGASAGAVDRAAASRPNFLVIVADDLGFSDLGAFGGEIETPNLDALARAGVRLTGFHTAPTCSPTRSMLLTGADNHKVGLGSMAEVLQPSQRGRPGYEGYLNDNAPSLAELLSNAGYQTLMVGKWHLGLTEDRSPAARGFQKSFALLQGLQHHFGDNQTPEWGAINERATFREGRVETTYPVGRYDADYFAERMVGFLKETDMSKPFFAYLTFTQPHWPLQAPAELIAKYKGRYDAGPAVLRLTRLERQKALGLVAADVKPHPVVDPKWDSLTPEQKAVDIRKMEVYAAMVDSLDQNVGKVIAQLKESGELDNTVIIFLSDNGPEGSVIETPGGRSGPAAPTSEALAKIGVDNSLASIGSRASYVTYGPEWAQAASAPSRLVKGFTTEGGIRATAFVSGPGVKGGRISGAFLHVKDITPTLLDLARVTAPSEYKGRKATPIEGHSWASLLQGKAEEARPADEAVGWELFFRRAIRRGDWKAVFLPKSTGPAYALPSAIEGDWELFNLKTDPGETRNLAAQEPERLKNLVAAWQAYAAKNGIVVPGAAPAAAAGSATDRVAAR